MIFLRPRLFGILHLREWNQGVSIRSITNLPHPQKFIQVEDGWKKRDGISRQWNLIYKAPMDNILNYTSTFLTVSTSIITGLTAYYGFFVLSAENMDNPVMFGEDLVMADSMTEGLVYLGAFYVLHIALRVLLSKFVVRLYQYEDKYIAIFRGYMHNSIKKHQFHLNDFKKLNPTLVVSWGDARFGLGTKHGIILEEYFKSPEYFNRLLYKKKLESDENE